MALLMEWESKNRDLFLCCQGEVSCRTVRFHDTTDFEKSAKYQCLKCNENLNTAIQCRPCLAMQHCSRVKKILPLEDREMACIKAFKKATKTDESTSEHGNCVAKFPNL